jgi:signal transduction histidine kinase
MANLTIKRRLIVTIMSILLASTAFMGFFAYRSNMNQLQMSLRDTALNDNRLFQTILSTDAEGLARAHAGLDRLDPLLRLFAEKKRDELLAAANPIFKELRQNNNITHMYFIEPDGTVFLRVHKPEEFGDKLTRATYKKAAETNTVASSLEMGKNFFSLRSVRPVSYQGKMIGYMEVAEEIDHVFKHMKAITGNDVALFLTANYLNRYSMDFHSERVGTFAILYPTNKDVSLRLATKVNGAMEKGLREFVVCIVDFNGAKYAVAMGPIQDAFGATAGILFSQRDVTPLYAAMWNGIGTSISVFAAIFIASLALLYLSLRKSLALFTALRQHILAVTKTWDLSGTLEVNTSDEIGELVGDFNLMKTEIQKLKENVEQRAEELSATNRELEAFSYSLSHDIRQPVTRISLAAQLLEDEYAAKLDENGRFLVQNIGEASEGMEELIKAMLVLSRISQSDMHRQEVDLSELAKLIAAELQLQEPERKVELVMPPALVAKGDEHLLKVVLKNLMENAWKYTRTVPQPRIEIGVMDHDGKAVFFVRDNGAGFDMKDADKLFKPFQRLCSSDEIPGTGIGLAIVQRIIHRHGGEIWGVGETGRGATFFFTLP